ncbi:MAG: hypothetical protein HUU06_02920 [Planctomycetaceae bacterium]|nr:hypothetical protein [Planctomycetaceae bacterium]
MRRSLAGGEASFSPRARAAWWRSRASPWSLASSKARRRTARLPILVEGAAPRSP